MARRQTMVGRLLMGEKERIRGKMMEMVKQKKMTLKAAIQVLKVSCRQGKRIYTAYKAGGDGALINGNTGKKSNNRIDRARREAAPSTAHAPPMLFHLKSRPPPTDAGFLLPRFSVLSSQCINSDADNE